MPRRVSIDREQVKVRYERGDRLRDIARDLGVSIPTIKRVRKSLGLPPRPYQSPKALDEESLRRMYGRKEKVSEICKGLGISLSTLKRRRERLHLHARPPGRVRTPKIDWEEAYNKNIWWVRAIANRIASRVTGVLLTKEDIVGVATLAFWEAVLRYRPGRGAKLNSYATLRVKGQVIKYVDREIKRTISLPRHTPFYDDRGYLSRLIPLQGLIAQELPYDFWMRVYHGLSLKEYRAVRAFVAGQECNLTLLRSAKKKLKRLSWMHDLYRPPTREEMHMAEPSKLKLRDHVIIYTPENPRLHNTQAEVLVLEDWGAVLSAPAAATGQFRALWEEMMMTPPKTGGAESVGDMESSPDAPISNKTRIVVERATYTRVVRETTGSMCSACGGANMVRTGACETCQDCGTSGGCA